MIDAYCVHSPNCDCSRLRLDCLCCRIAGPWPPAAPPLPAEDAAPAAPKITYDEHVRPILREHCATCHNHDTKKSDLAIDSYAAIMRGGASGEVVVAGNPDGSRLWALVNHTDEPKMPPKQDKLPEAKLATDQGLDRGRRAGECRLDGQDRKSRP